MADKLQFQTSTQTESEDLQSTAHLQFELRPGWTDDQLYVYFNWACYSVSNWTSI